MNKYNLQIASVDLSSEVTNLEFNSEGSFITHIQGSSEVTIRLDAREEDAIPLTPKDSIVMPENVTFKKFFVSGAGGQGVIQLMFGKPTLFEMHQSHTSGGGVGTGGSPGNAGVSGIGPSGPDAPGEAGY